MPAADEVTDSYWRGTSRSALHGIRFYSVRQIAALASQQVVT